MNVTGALTRKIGPLPAWGWGIAIGGALLAAKMLRGGGGTSKTATVYVPTGGEVGSTDFASSVGNEFATFREEVGDALDDLRDEIADIESPQMSAPSGQQPPASTIIPPGTGVIQPLPVPQPSQPPTTKAPATAPYKVGTRIFSSLADAQAFARRVIRDYSPKGALYGKGMAGRPATRKAIPIIPGNVLSLDEQRRLAKQYGGTLLSDVR